MTCSLRHWADGFTLNLSKWPRSLVNAHPEPRPPRPHPLTTFSRCTLARQSRHSKWDACVCATSVTALVRLVCALHAGKTGFQTSLLNGMRKGDPRASNGLDALSPIGSTYRHVLFYHPAFRSPGLESGHPGRLQVLPTEMPSGELGTCSAHHPFRPATGISVPWGLERRGQCGGREGLL